MLDFATHFTIHTTKIGFQKKYILPRKFILESRSSVNSLPK